MSQKLYDLAVVGEINPDLILSGNVMPRFGQVEQNVDDLTLTIGSSAVIFACGAARLGLRVLFIGKVGSDAFGQFMLNAMRERLRAYLAEAVAAAIVHEIGSKGLLGIS